MSGISNKHLCVIFFALLSFCAALSVVWFRRQAPVRAEPASSASATSRQLAGQVAALEAREEKAAETVWAKELLAEKCGVAFESLWDSLNAASNRLDVAARFPVGEIVLPDWSRTSSLPYRIVLREPAGVGPVLSSEKWRLLVEEFDRAGWQLVQTEFRHTRFDTDETGKPRQSRFCFSAHLIQPALPKRAIIEGDLIVDWAATPPGETPGAIRRIDASGLTLKTRQGGPFFQSLISDKVTPVEKACFIDPLILYDLDGDGLSEIILAAQNLVYRCRGEPRYEPEPLCSHPPGSIFTGVVADFDGDGTADFLCAKSEGVFMFKGSPRGAFDEPGQAMWQATQPLRNAIVMTCGDIDQDGDLDVFLAQYRVPALGQIIRPYYYDSNDGHSSYLLLNDGKGNFTDATEAAGLGKKRWRRTLSASFVDLNDDGSLDLVVVSDFAGVDLHINDGHGHFTDVTRDWIADAHAFGMSHALADFNVDGRLDFLMIGMNSPTVDRLEHLGLTRPGSTGAPEMRRMMSFGNRLYVARPEGGFEQSGLNTPIARTGWSWGCSASDFDNDGFPDIYIANGHQSKQWVRDYEPEFWLHDIFIDDSASDYAASAYFMTKFARTRAQGWSYGGYEKNRLFLNRRGESFVEIGHLAGVALEADSRNVVADDLDGDGRLDLLVTTFEVWPETQQTLRVYRNVLNETGHWIAFRFREEGEGRSPPGVKVALHYSGRTAVRQVVTGDGFRSQHANTLHFGLGETIRVESAEIRWADGRAVALHNPAIDRCHYIPAPRQGPLQR